MVEWFKAAVLKTAVAQVTEGSNPSFSANYLQISEWLIKSPFRYCFSPIFVIVFIVVIKTGLRFGRWGGY